MKKAVLCCMLALILIFCCACGQVGIAPEPTAEPTQSHICTNLCEVCGICTDENCTIFREDYITTEPISVDTGTLVFDIGENVYVPGSLPEMGKIISAEMEKATGLNFDGAGYGRDYFPDGKVHVNISRDRLYVGKDWYTGLPTSEVGNAHADPVEHVFISPGEFLLGHGYAIVHELAHVLMFRQSEWSHSQLLNEGFAEYTTFLVLSDLEKTNPQAAFYLDESTNCVENMWIDDYDKLFERPIEYWFENTFEYAGNANYAVGFRFMAYLHEMYGDYGKWIPAFEQQYCYKYSTVGSNTSTVERQIEVLKATYGEDVLDNFYPWLKENLERFEPDIHYLHVRDLTSAGEINWYPGFNAHESVAEIDNLKYKDLYIDLEPMRKYLSEYKQHDSSDLLLVTSEPVEVSLHRADGTCTTVMTNSQKLEEPITIAQWSRECAWSYLYTTTDMVLPLDGISYIKLVGEGELELMQIIGDFRALSFEN